MNWLNPIAWMDRYDFGLMWFWVAVGCALIIGCATLAAVVEGIRGVAAWAAGWRRDAS